MIVLRSAEEIGHIRNAGRIVAFTLSELKKSIRSGVMTEDLDELARKVILAKGAYPAFKGYKGYPGNVCISINEVVVHGIPSSRALQDGDIVSIDVGVKCRDYFADAAITVPVGSCSRDADRLIETTKESLRKGIDQAVPGNRLSDISHAVQTHVEAGGFSVVRAFVGHGIGTKIHEPPEIPNFGPPKRGPRLEAGMVLAIEPMVNAGTHEIEILDDGWTAVTKDRKLSAHFEHTVVVTEGHAEILTIL